MCCEHYAANNRLIFSQRQAETIVCMMSTKQYIVDTLRCLQYITGFSGIYRDVFCRVSPLDMISASFPLDQNSAIVYVIISPDFSGIGPERSNTLRQVFVPASNCNPSASQYRTAVSKRLPASACPKDDVPAIFAEFCQFPKQRIITLACIGIPIRSQTAVKFHRNHCRTAVCFRLKFHEWPLPIFHWRIRCSRFTSHCRE